MQQLEARKPPEILLRGSAAEFSAINAYRNDKSTNDPVQAALNFQKQELAKTDQLITEAKKIVAGVNKIFQPKVVTK